jgi:Tol biopolymer transport system component
VTRHDLACAAALAFLLLLCRPLSAANRYDPRFRFRTISTAHFNIYFHQGEDALARRLAGIAEEVADRLRRDLGVPTGRVHVILVDQTDLSNGWSTPVPYNLIEMTAAAPSGKSMIGNTDDWLRLVFSHEYTHIVHLDTSRGWVGGLRSVFGRAAVLYPNLFLPLWQIEGIATYDESALTGEGRVPAGDFRLVVDRAAAVGRFEPIDRANGGLVDWPSGAAHYTYGAYFHQYLADRFGPDSLVRLSEDTARRLPYFGARAFRKVYGRPLGALWDDFEADTRARVRRDEDQSTRLTRHGFSVDAPRFSPSGRLFYSINNPHGFPALMELPRDGSAPRQVTTKYLGGRFAASGGALVFDQMEVVHNVGLQSDLYVVSENGGSTRRLTVGARAADPDVSPDGRTIVCTVQSADRRALATLPLSAQGRAATPVPLVSDPSTDFSSPRWSPDGRSIVAERRRLEGPSEIVVVDPATGHTRTVVSSVVARNVSPAWLPDGKAVLFASDRNGAPFEIYRADTATGVTRKLTGAGRTAQSPEVSADGRELVFVGYTVEGYDLFSLPLASATWTDVPPEPARAVKPAPIAPIARKGAVESPYRPWRTLTPQFWLPVVRSDHGEVVGGAETAGADALGRHSYAGTVGWSLSRLRPDWVVAYAYDRWWPTLFATVSDDTDPWNDGELRTREVNAGALFPMRRVRWTSMLLAAFSGSTDAFDCPRCGLPIRASAKRRALRLGWRFDSAKSYGYSISRETGTTIRVTSETTRHALGADGDAAAVTLDARGYRRAFLRHGVIAPRFAAATAWGDPSVRRRFSAAGTGPQTGDFNFGSDAIGLLRGVDANAITGRHAVVGNLDFRFPLVSIQRGVGTLPFFLRTAHAAIFADAGHAWNDAFRWSNAHTSFGAELSLDSVIGYSLPVTFATGVAWRDDPGTSRRGFATFGRIGRAF